jgi:hypothetical protein
MVDDVPLAAVSAQACHRVDRPILAAVENLTVTLRIGSAPDE